MEPFGRDEKLSIVTKVTRKHLEETENLLSWWLSHRNVSEEYEKLSFV